MADLRAMVAARGYTDVRTVLNSGNVLFTARTGIAGAEAAIAQALAQAGLNVRVVVRSTATLRQVLAGNPFGDAIAVPARLLVGLFMGGTLPPAILALARRDWSPDRVACVGEAAFLACTNSILDSPLILAFDKEAGDSVTLRNWTTMTRLTAAGT